MADSRGSRSKSIVGAVMLALVAVSFTPTPASAATATTTLVSVTTDGTSGNGSSQEPDVTPDGRYVAFSSNASNLVADDTNGTVGDVFLHDRTSRNTTLVSKATDGTQGNMQSLSPSISADGRFVAFGSSASNLVAGDTNNLPDIFVRDLLAGTTSRVSVTSAGGEGTGLSVTAGSTGPDISADGRYVAFQSTTDLSGSPAPCTCQDVYVHDRQTATTSKASVPDGAPSQSAVGGPSSNPAISADGQFVAFQSSAQNLVSGDTNGLNNGQAGEDVFVHDRTTSATTRVSVTSAGSQTDNWSRFPSMSADGRHVAFLSRATNLVSGDTNGVQDAFVHDRTTGATTRVSVASDGAQANDHIDKTGGISANGAFVSFATRATNLISGDTNDNSDVFVHDRVTATTTRRSLANDGSQVARGSSQTPVLSADGTVVAFDSTDPGLVGGDLNTGLRDVFVRDIADETVESLKPVVSVGDVGVPEGDEGKRAAMFVVSLSKASSNTVTASYSTASGTAESGGDFIGKSGTISFAPGTTSMAIKVAAVGDLGDESNETFALTLSGVTEAIVGDANAVGTILDDDPKIATGWGLAVGDSTVYEGDSGARTAVFTVSLNKPRNSEITVSYAAADGFTGTPEAPPATAPADFTAKSGTLSFAPGVTRLTVKVPITTDNTTEATEQFQLVLSNNSTGTYLAKSVGSGGIVDDD